MVKVWSTMDRSGDTVRLDQNGSGYPILQRVYPFQPGLRNHVKSRTHTSYAALRLDSQAFLEEDSLRLWPSKKHWTVSWSAEPAWNIDVQEVQHRRT